MSVAREWDCQHIYSEGAFLHAIIPKDNPIWIQLPKFPSVAEADGPVIKLVKSLYGTREAPKL